MKQLQHTLEIDETFETYNYNIVICNICNTQIKQLKHALEHMRV
jgi:hypothetical protein